MLTCALMMDWPGPLHFTIRHNPPVSRLKAGAFISPAKTKARTDLYTSGLPT